MRRSSPRAWRRGSPVLFGAVALSASLGIARTAAAGPKDSSAKAEDDRAMNSLFMAAHFDDAKQVLSQAIEDCRTGCSKRMRARLHRDLGVVYVTGLNDAEAGKAEFRQARSLDPKIVLDPMVTTPEVQTAFDAAKASPLEQDVSLEDEGEPEEKKKAPKEAAAEEETEEPACSADSDCKDGASCKKGQCVEKPPAPSSPSVWLSAGLVQDFLIISGSNVCTEKSQLGNYTCLRASGSQYHGTPLPGAGGSLSGGPALAGTRITIATYLPLASKVSAGLRLGYAFLGQGPQPDGGKAYLPIQVEVQGAYWLTSHAFSTDEVGFFLQASAGVAEFDGKGSVTVQEDTSAPKPPNQIDNPPQQKLDVYQKAGTAFFGAGAGTFLPFGRRVGLLVDLRFTGLFPSSGFGASLGVSGAFGL